MKPDLQRIIELQRLLAKFNEVERAVHRKHLGKFVHENDTEHSYNLAITAWYLASHFPKLDRDLVIRYGLIHDLVEVHAGDTYIYGSAEHLDSKETREAEALKQLESEWPDFKELTDHIHDYEAKKNPESQFIYALDKIMPIMQIYIHDGYSWKKNNVTAKMLHEAKITRLSKVGESPEILSYFKELYALLLERPDLINKE